MPLLSDSLRNLSSSLLIAALLIAGLVAGQDVLIPLTLAVLLAFILSPIVRWMARLRVPRGLAVTVVMLALLALVFGFAGVVSNQVISLTAGLDSYRTNVLQKVRAVTGGGATKSDISKAADAVDALGNAIKQEIASANAPKPDATAPVATAPGKQTVVVTQKSPADETSFLDYAKKAGEPLAQTALMLLFTLFLLLQHQDLRDRVVRVVGTDHMTETTSAMGEAGERLSQLFLTQALLNMSFGAFVGVALWGIGVPNAVLWALVTAVMRFVPFIGSFLAAIPPVLLAAAVDPGWGMLFATLALFLIGEPIMGHIIEPLVLGKRAGISPFAMIASASFWTLVWGPVGLVLAAPLTMALIVLGRYITGLEFFSVLLGDEPALSPHHEFYHRMLSDDAVSAAGEIEAALEHATFAEVSDALIFPSLRLAAHDVRRGRLDKQQIADLTDTSNNVLKMIADDRDVPEPSDQDDGRDHILVIPARGPVDAIAGKFIGQLLVESVPSSKISVSASSGLTALSDAQGQSATKLPNALVLATVSAIDAQQLRFIVKRAARDFPGVRLLVMDFRLPEEGGAPRDKDFDDTVTLLKSPGRLAALLGHSKRSAAADVDRIRAQELKLAV